MDTTTITNIQNGVEMTGQAAQLASSIISLYNPTLANAISMLAPIITSFVVKESQILINMNKDMSNAELIEALKQSKSDNWNIEPLV
jgi:hypothetical protein